MPSSSKIGARAGFLADERGATAIEYALIAAVMAMILLATFSLLEDPMNVAFQLIADTFEDSAQDMMLIE
ncbi:Flp family type IVb pilin [Salinarimonas rosea]|uniref:Flp family type IVb pilin n=1 Tax=Salinarimonas rosea TaxID=552063 RepID=UPI0003F87B19|nr:Flp family type IVb pilin [Salinarimonas rosea]